MRPHSLTLITLGFALMLSGCSLFHADFEADTVGAPPSSSPAGRPTGDMIRIWLADPGNLVVVPNRDICDVSNTKSLIYSYQQPVSQADFIGIERRRAVQEFWAVWDGRAQRFSSTTPRFFFTVGNHNTGTANLEIVNGEFRASGERIVDVEPDEVHSVIMHVDNREGTYSVTIDQTTSTARRSACPEGFRFEGGECRSGPDLWPPGAMAHCPLEGRTGCATCGADECLDTMTGTCILRRRSSVTSSVRPLSGRGVMPGDLRLSIVMSYDNITDSDPASYIIDDIWITTTRDP